MEREEVYKSMQLKNKKTPLVSVIVPAYNEEKHIEECLVSIKNQTYSKIELIFVDDGSTDSTKKIAKKYTDILLTQKHQGPGAAKNNAVKNASGDILIFIDADMYLDNKFIEKIIAPIIKEKAWGTSTNEEYLANEDNIWVKCGNIDNNIPKGKRFRSAMFSFAARAINRNLFLKLNGMNPLLGYRDDQIFLGTQYKAYMVKGAVCYHYNPDTLLDVYSSAMWIGRNPILSNDIRNLFRYSVINSAINSLRKVKSGAPIFFICYKYVFDFGIFCGILTRRFKKNYAK